MPDTILFLEVAFSRVSVEGRNTNMGSYCPHSFLPCPRETFQSAPSFDVLRLLPTLLAATTDQWKIKVVGIKSHLQSPMGSSKKTKRVTGVDLKIGTG